MATREPKSSTASLFALAIAIGIIAIAGVLATGPDHTVTAEACQRMCAPMGVWVWEPARCECEPAP